MRVLFDLGELVDCGGDVGGWDSGGVVVVGAEIAEGGVELGC